MVSLTNKERNPCIYKYRMKQKVLLASYVFVRRCQPTHGNRGISLVFGAMDVAYIRDIYSTRRPSPQLDIA